MSRFLAGMGGLSIVAAAFLLALPSHGAQPAGQGRLQVMTTLFPLYDWARVIGGDEADVMLLLPPGVESHSFEPTPKDITTINRADLFIYTGKSMEPWVEDILRGKINEDLLVVDTSRGGSLLTEENEHGGVSPKGAGQEVEHGKELHGHGHGDAHDAAEHGDHGGKDPHIWLDFHKARKMVDTIAEAFAGKDPAHADTYLRRAAEYKIRLDALDADYEKGLSTCRLRTVIYGGHFAFGYMARRYGLEAVSPYGGLTPDAEPSPRRIAELIGVMKKLGAKYVYFEEGIEPRVAKIIGEETGARLLLLHGAHNIGKDDLAGGTTYLGIMKENLERLKLGLECS